MVWRAAYGRKSASTCAQEDPAAPAGEQRFPRCRRRGGCRIRQASFRQALSLLNTPANDDQPRGLIGAQGQPVDRDGTNVGPKRGIEEIAFIERYGGTGTDQIFADRQAGALPFEPPSFGKRRGGQVCKHKSVTPGRDPNGRAPV